MSGSFYVEMTLGPFKTEEAAVYVRDTMDEWLRSDRDLKILSLRTTGNYRQPINLPSIHEEKHED